MTVRRSLNSTVSELLGTRSLRDFQRRTCEALLEGLDVLLVAPTGTGKSLCYQILTKLSGKPTLVLSPLIALMDDQAAGSARLSLKSACLHSGIDTGQQWMTVASWMSGTLQLLYTSPERVRDSRLLAALDTVPPGLIVIDEAHCIATWGRRFRPAYRQIRELVRKYTSTPVLAMTATAKSEIQSDIIDALALKKHITVSEPLTLTCIKLESLKSDSAAERSTILSDLARRDDLFPMVVFCLLKKHCEAVTNLLQNLDLNAFSYHAGMSLEQRSMAAGLFQVGGKKTVLVATSAYEMGVNVPGIRSVIHCGLPASLESYVQGIGRAGRDGLPATAILIYCDADLDVLDSLEKFGVKSHSDTCAPDGRLNFGGQEVYAYAGTQTCRKAFLRAHFHPELGSVGSHRCGRCDNCVRLGVRPTRYSRQVASVTLAMKKWRKQVAEAAEIPALTVFTDRELARIASQNPLSEIELVKVAGVRQANVYRYGTELIELLRQING